MGYGLPDVIFIIGISAGRATEEVQKQVSELCFEIMVSGVIPLAPQSIIEHSENPDTSKVDVERILDIMANKRNIENVLLAVPESLMDEDALKTFVKNNEPMKDLIGGISHHLLDVYVDLDSCISNSRGIDIDEWLDEWECEEEREKERAQMSSIFERIRPETFPTLPPKKIGDKNAV